MNCFIFWGHVIMTLFKTLRDAFINANVKKKESRSVLRKSNQTFSYGKASELCWDGLVGSMSAFHAEGRGFASRSGHTMTIIKMVQSASLFAPQALS